MVAMATCNGNLEDGGVPTNSIISLLLLTIADLNWYQIKAKSQAFSPVVRYLNYLICIFIHINESLKHK